MGQRYLLDSNTIIDYTANLLPQPAAEVIDVIINNEFNISVVVKIEVLGFNDIPTKIKQLETFLGMANVIYLDEKVVDKAIDLRRKYKRLKLGDAIIAATGIVNRLTIVSRNEKDFKGISDLDLLNPYSL